MKYYQTTTEFNCGVDLHSRQMYACVMDRPGNVLVSTNINGNHFQEFLRRVEPYRHDLTVTCECTFNWYWFADACQDAGLKFVLAHALYLGSIHGGKHKNDREDAKELADILRTNRLPPAYVYPRELRAIRTLLRRRLHFVWLRSELIGHLACGVMAEGGRPVGPVRYHPNKAPWFEKVLSHYQDHPLLTLAAEADMDVIQCCDKVIQRLQDQIVQHTRRHAGRDFNLLMTIPGVGEVLALTILYEIGSLDRFERVQDFSSYCRLVKGTVASAGKIMGWKGAKLGNGYLKWAFREAAVLCKKADTPLRAFAQRLEAQKGKYVAYPGLFMNVTPFMNKPLGAQAAKPSARQDVTRRGVHPVANVACPVSARCSGPITAAKRRIIRGSRIIRATPSWPTSSAAPPFTCSRTGKDSIP